MRSSDRGRRRLLLVFAAVALVAAACGSDDGTDAGDETEASTVATEAAVEETTTTAAAVEESTTTAAAVEETEATEAPAELVPLKIVMPPCFCTSYIADAKGFYEAAGMEVEIVPASALGVGVVQAVLQGDVQTGPPISFGGQLLAHANGADIVTVLNGYTSQPGDFQTFRFYVAEDSDIATAADLVGRRIGLAALGSGGDFVLTAYLAENGLADTDVERVVVPASELGTALTSGQIDVAILWDVLYAQLERQGGAKLFINDLDVTTLPSDQLTNSYFFTTSFIEENPDTVRAFVDVERSTQEWILDNPDEAKQIIADVSGISEDNLITPTFGPPSCMPVDAADTWSAMMSTVWPEVQPADGSSIVTNEFNSAC